MKIKVLLAVPNLDPFGVQHDIRTLMQHWDKENFDVRMLLHSRTGDFSSQFPKEMESIEVDNYSLNIPKLRVLSRLNGYRRAINEFKPDVVVSFVPFPNYACIWAKIFGKHKFKLVVSEHAHVTAAMKDPENMANLFMKFYRFTFSYFYNSNAVDVVKCIAEESRQDLIKNHGIKEEKTVLIYNPIPMSEIGELSKEEVKDEWFNNAKSEGKPILINFGRLKFQKRLDILIQAFAKVKKEIDCKLVLVGGGDQKPLEELAKNLKVENDVYFAGFDKNPWKWAAKSDLFVLSSIWEGLPCVVTESVSLGLPVVSTRCPSGPTEILLNGKGGYLCEVENVDDLADKILYALKNPQETAEKVKIGKENLYRFEPEHVVRQYQDLVKKLARS